MAYIGTKKVITVLRPVSTNGVSANLQPIKTVNITTNGTVNVTADGSYDGLSKVEVNVNVPTGGGSATIEAWNSTTSYKIGDCVIHEGSVYRLVTSLPQWECKPAITSSAYWERLNTYVYEERYSPIACYKAGTIAKYNGSVYLCIQDEPNMGYYPDQNPEYWEKLND